MKEKISNLFEAIKRVSFATWMLLCGIIFGGILISFVNVFMEGNNALIIIIVYISFIVMVAFYSLAIMILNKRDEEAAQRAQSIKNHEIQQKYALGDNRSYEKYLNKATDYYMMDLFGENMNLGVACSIIDFVESEGKVLNLYSINLFSSYIHDHWEGYENKEITFYCFVTPRGPLSMTPLNHSTFSYNYDTEILKLLKYKKSAFIDSDKYFIDELSWQMENTYKGKINRVRSFNNNTFDRGFRVPDRFDYSIIRDEDDLGVFVKVTGTLAKDKYSNNIIIEECCFEKSNYRSYVSNLKEQYENFEYELPKYAER